MGLFYAYAKNIHDDTTWRYLITFASREVADEWWRAVSETQTRFNRIQRVTPQFYTHDPSTAKISESITDPAFNSFSTKIMFTLIVDRDGRTQNTIPSLDITDHLSGKWYYIRTKCTPYEYWYLEDNIITISKDDRTPFRISISGGNPGRVMIASDAITIAAQADFDPESPLSRKSCLEETLVKVNAEAQLCIDNKRPNASGLVKMKFGDFQDRLCVLRSDRTVRLLAGSGTPWELVH